MSELIISPDEAKLRLEVEELRRKIQFLENKINTAAGVMGKYQSAFEAEEQDPLLGSVFQSFTNVLAAVRTILELNENYK